MRRDRLSGKVVRRLGKADAPKCIVSDCRRLATRMAGLCDFHAGEEATEEARSEFNRGLARDLSNETS